jgi:hypothetical protein
VKGRPWRVHRYDPGVRQDAGALLAELSDDWFNEKDAHAVAQFIASYNREQVTLVPPGRSRYRSSIHVQNPTLWHHGAAPARYHLITTQTQAAVADLWTSPQRAKRIAQAIANIVGAQVSLLDNENLPKGFPSGHRIVSAPGPRKRKRKAGNPRSRGEVDETAATELELFIENDADLYRQQHVPILQNLWRKMKRGVYDHNKAVKMWSYLVESGAKKYVKEFDAPGAKWHEVFNVPTRERVAQSLAVTGYTMLTNHEFSWQGEKKNPPRHSRRIRRSLATGRFTKAQHHARESARRGVRRADLQRRRSFRVGRANPFPHPFVVTSVHNGTQFFISQDPAETATDIPTRAKRYARKAQATAAAKRATNDFGWSWQVGRGFTGGVGNPGMSYAQAVKHLGADHVAHIVARGDRELGNRMAGAWAANNLKSLAAYEAVRIHHFGTAWITAKNPKLAVGDRVQYAAAFLRSTGMLTGPLPFAKGVVTHIDPTFGGGLATIQWDTPEAPPRVLVANLKKVGAREANPRGERHRSGPRAGSFWRRLGVPSYVARVVKTERAKDGMPPMVNLEIVEPGRGQLRHLPMVVGTTRIPVNEFFANHEPTQPNPGRARSRRTLSVPERHQLRIARKSLTLQPPFDRIFGMPHDEAREVIRRLTGREPKENRGRRVRARRRNPSTEVAHARRTFRKWHGFDSSRAVRLTGPDRRIPRTLVKLGDVPEFIYRSNKWEGKPVTYSHKTSRPQPVLATDPAGKYLYLVGGRTKVTADGLVH